MFQPNKSIKGLAFIFGVIALSVGLSYAVSAWTEPSANPPTPNVSTPLNIGSTGQSKAGNLTIHNATNTALLNPDILSTIGGVILNTSGAPTGLIVSSGAVNLPANSIDSSEVGFNYAGSASKGGAASNVVCTNCITLG
ncbi:hypothetical protein KKA96_03030, partial [Patescibacteria group bacterium]|nr:hypothetical protein [Patescibacteria group bacterium]